jgi:hypothetical protein
MKVFAILSELHAERRRIVSEIQSLERLASRSQVQTDRRRSRKISSESRPSREIKGIAVPSKYKLRLSLVPRTIG